MRCDYCDGQIISERTISVCLSCIEKLVLDKQKSAYLFVIKKKGQDKPIYDLVLGIDELMTARDKITSDGGEFYGVFKQINVDGNKCKTEQFL